MIDPFTEDEPGMERTRVLQSFRDATKLPDHQVPVRFTQRGSDRHQGAEYFMEMPDGRRLRIGTADQMSSQAEIRKTLMVATKFVIPQIKAAKWIEVIAGLIGFATDDEAPDDTLAEWLTMYLGRRTRGDRDHSATAREPFTADGFDHVHPEHFARFIRAEIGEQVRSRDVRSMLEAAGYESFRVNYYPDGQRETDRAQCRYMRRHEAARSA